MQIKAKKYFGQNFLKDQSVKQKIIKAIPKSDLIVEIGPGLGDLTRELLGICHSLRCFEIDTELFAILQKSFANEIKSAHLELINADASALCDDEISQKSYFLAANLPYYVATNMILRALRDERCLGFVVMIQREVALKFSAQPKQSEHCALSLLASLYGDCELLFEVLPNCFEPAPKVTSAVIRLIKVKKAKLENKEIKNFENFLRLAFISPRKTLLKNLSTNFDKTRLEQIFKILNLSQTIRPHELNLTLFLDLFKEFSNAKYK